MKRLCLAISACLLMILFSACGHTHDFGEWDTVKEATCERPGLEVRECRCGEEKEREIPELEHKYKIEEEEASSCQGAGSKTYVCKRCDDSYTETEEQTKYTSTDLYYKYLNSVGEIIVYDKKGNSISLGSCFVYSEDGLLVTNYHVIEGGYSAEVTFGEDTYEIEQVLAYDQEIDAAALKITADDLEPVTLCDLEHKVGEIVYAFGNSKGMTSTFSDGMITYSDRESEGVHYVQHDAPISSGNSGGPLINEYGEVIGINTLTIVDSQNLNFAIRISELDNLDYEQPLTMEEFYQKESDGFKKAATHIVENGEYDSDDGYYLLVLNSTYDEDLSYAFWAEYYPEDEHIEICFAVDGTNYAWIEIDKNLSGVYDWYYFDDDYQMSGTVNASTFTEDTQLTYDYTDIYSSEVSGIVRTLASTMVVLICDEITIAFEEIDVSAADFGFIYF